MNAKSQWAFWSVACTVLLVALGPAAREGLAQEVKTRDVMSSMGRLAAAARARIAADTAPVRALVAPGGRSIDNDDLCQNDPSCPGGFREAPDNTQSELSIAIDRTGKNVVIGFNDFRGFANSPVSLSGYMYSSDGGKTFVDGGQLPVTTGTEMLGTTVLPQIFGDPEVKYLGACTFIYSSILIKKFSATGVATTRSSARHTSPMPPRPRHVTIR